MPDKDAAPSKVCPNCGASVPIHEGYPSWCDRCEWNLTPHQPRHGQDRGRFATVYESLGQQRSDALYEQVVRSNVLDPPLTVAEGLAYALATLVHISTLAFATLGIWLLLLARRAPLALFGVLVCGALVWTLAPRLGRLPGGIAPRRECPTLYDLADRVARALNTPPVAGIVLTDEFNAAFGQVGRRRQGILYLGLPLWEILDDRERVALLAHELAHGANGDANQDLFIASAIETLARWHALLYPPRMYRHYAREDVAPFAIANAICIGLAQIPLTVAYALLHLLWQERQRGEYLADLLAAMVSGTEAAVAALRKLHYDATFAITLQRLALGGAGDRPLFAQVRERMAMVPAREIERLQRVQQLVASRLDVTHPPTAYRLKMLDAHRVAEPTVTLASADAARIDAEIAHFRERIEQRLLLDFQQHLYR